MDELQGKQVALQKMRAMAFYNDVRNKRQAKIKSRSYRRVHKKKPATDNLIDRMQHEFDRAKERISLRHKSSQKYSMDKEATEMEKDITKDDLRRIAGLKEKMKADSSDSELDSTTEHDRENSIPLSKTFKGLMSMKFMQHAKESHESSTDKEEEDADEYEGSIDSEISDHEDSIDEGYNVLSNDFILDLSKSTTKGSKRSFSELTSPRKMSSESTTPAEKQKAPIDSGRSKLQFQFDSLMDKAVPSKAMAFQRELLQTVFSVDQTLEDDFSKEKGEVVKEEAPKIKDETLPGWVIFKILN